MAKSAPCAVILLAFASAIGQASSGDASETEFRQRVAELRKLLNEDDSRISGLEKAPEMKKNRRLDAKKPTIYFNDPEDYSWRNNGKWRAYTQLEEFNGAMDHMWLILCGALVMFMQAGFAMVEAGCCRAKNAQAIMLKNFTDVCVGSFGWYIFGWSFAFSGPFDSDGYKENGFIGSEEFAAHTFLGSPPEQHGLDHQIEPTGKMKNWFFQWAFCATAATIVSGGVAERVNFVGYSIVSFCMTSWIYPVVVAWTWGNGWLANLNDTGYMDFAGSGIVHMAGGIGAFVGALIAGPRKDRFGTAEAPQTLQERLYTVPNQFLIHSSPLVVLGTFILWFGWYGFNCGSTLAMHTAAQGMMAAQVAMNTTISASVCGLTVFLIRYGLTMRQPGGGKYDVGGFCNGILSGLVAITAGCGNVEAGSAFLIAIIAGFLYHGTSMAMKAMRIDDVRDVFAVHGACGLWGVLAAALFDWGQGLDHVHAWAGFNCMGYNAATGTPCTTGLGGQLIAANIAEIFAIGGWVALWCTLLFLILWKVGLLREEQCVPPETDVKKSSPPKAYQYTGGAEDDDEALHIV